MTPLEGPRPEAILNSAPKARTRTNIGAAGTDFAEDADVGQANPGLLLDRLPRQDSRHGANCRLDASFERRFQFSGLFERPSLLSSGRSLAADLLVAPQKVDPRILPSAATPLRSSPHTTCRRVAAPQPRVGVVQLSEAGVVGEASASRRCSITPHTSPATRMRGPFPIADSLNTMTAWMLRLRTCREGHTTITATRTSLAS